MILEGSAQVVADVRGVGGIAVLTRQKVKLTAHAQPRMRLPAPLTRQELSAPINPKLGSHNEDNGKNTALVDNMHCKASMVLQTEYSYKPRKQPSNPHKTCYATILPPMHAVDSPQ